MFQGHLRIRGTAGAVLWGYRTAATLTGWSIQRAEDQPGKPGQWTLTGTVARADAFQTRQRPLLFTAPRDKGMWAWQILELQLLGPHHLRAILGPPEQ